MSLRDVPDAHRIAHLLRRTTFGPFPGQVEAALDDGGYDVLLEQLLASEPIGLGRGGVLDPDHDEERLWDLVPTTWLRLFLHPTPNLHSKLMWIWHSHFTSSTEKAEVPFMWHQLRLIHRHALGNLRDFVVELTTDSAMLSYLDGDGSVVEAPNENYSRELMELFTLGHGAPYTEADVRAGAKALAGWFVDWEAIEEQWEHGVDLDTPIPARMEEGAANTIPRRYLGTTVVTAQDVARTAVAHEWCAPHIVRTLWHHLIGTPSPADRVAELARRFRRNDMEILPLVTDLLTSAEFAASEYARPRYPVEWWPAAALAGGAEPADLDGWVLHLLGQAPGEPPNVAGWPKSAAVWLSASQAFTKAEVATWLPIWELDLGGDGGAGVVGAGDIVEAALDRCSIATVSDQTRNAIRTAVHGAEEWDRVPIAMQLALASPEFSLS